ncbi:MAG: TrmH family RNA methyltransferase [Anaeroplasma sp.]
MMIESVDNPKIKELLKLKLSKYRKQNKKFIVEGPHLVLEAKNANVLIEAYSLEAKEGYTQVSTKVMKALSNTDTIVTEIGLCEIKEKNVITDKILILDSVQDPGNMGTLLRTACAFSFKTIVLANGCVDVYNDKVIRSSQGAIFKLNIVNDNIINFINNHKDYDIYGTDVTNGTILDNIKPNKKIAIVLGNEGNGISKDVKNALKKNIYIPMDNTESLNVAIAGAIIMYKFR